VNILLCLVSAQHVPNLLSVQHFRPDQLVLVETVSMKKNTENLLGALKVGGLDYHARHDIVRLDAEDSLPAVTKALNASYDLHPSASWIVNLTGGTKPMSIGTYVFFKTKEARLVYTNFAKPTEFLDIDAETKEYCQHHLTIKEFIAGYGFEYSKHDAAILEGEDRAAQRWECARQIACHANSSSLLPLSDEDRSAARKRGWTLVPHQVEHESESVLRSIATAFALDPGDRSGRVDKYVAEFLTGGWLEEFLWGLLMKQSNALGIWDVRLGLRVRRCGDSTDNDLDVALMYNHGLALIECKSGSQQHDKHADVLYKIEAVVRQFGALRARSYLVTTAENILEKGAIKAHIQTRAQIYDCRILTSAAIRQLADNPDDVGCTRKALFAKAGSI
jgi:hypothetical protein